MPRLPTAEDGRNISVDSVVRSHTQKKLNFLLHLNQISFSQIWKMKQISLKILNFCQENCVFNSCLIQLFCFVLPVTKWRRQNSKRFQTPLETFGLKNKITSRWVPRSLHGGENERNRLVDLSGRVD